MRRKGGGCHQRGIYFPAHFMLAVLMLVWVGTAFSEEPATTVPLCRHSLGCLQQMVDDLRSYREYLEDQLSLAKSLLTEANQRLAAQSKELQALRVPGAAPEKQDLTK